MSEDTRPADTPNVSSDGYHEQVGSVIHPTDPGIRSSDSTASASSSISEKRADPDAAASSKQDRITYRLPSELTRKISDLVGRSLHQGREMTRDEKRLFARYQAEVKVWREENVPGFKERMAAFSDKDKD